MAKQPLAQAKKIKSRKRNKLTKRMAVISSDCLIEELSKVPYF